MSTSRPAARATVTLEGTLRSLASRAAENVENLERNLEQARAHAALVAAAARTGDLTPLVTADLTAVAVLEELIPHLTVEHVRVLLSRPWDLNLVQIVQQRVERAAMEGSPLAQDLVRLVITASAWPGDQRVRLLASGLVGDRAREVLRAVVESDPAAAVLFGMHLSRRPAGWTQEEKVSRLRKRLAGGAQGDRYRLGLAFRGGMRDAQLEWDLVQLLATIDHPDVAARLVVEFPPLTTDSSAAIAQRLADLETVVAAVAR